MKLWSCSYCCGSAPKNWFTVGSESLLSIWLLINTNKILKHKPEPKYLSSIKIMTKNTNVLIVIFIAYLSGEFQRRKGLSVGYSCSCRFGYYLVYSDTSSDACVSINPETTPSPARELVKVFSFSLFLKDQFVNSDLLPITEAACQLRSERAAAFTQ